VGQYAAPIRNLVAILLIAALVLGTIGFVASLDWMVVLALVPFVASFVVSWNKDLDEGG
jgi:hypothetical protein